jgi:hypothetical protein
LRSIVDDYGLFPNFWTKLAWNVTNWQIRALGIWFEVYDVSVIRLDVSFLGDRLNEWALTALCFGLRDTDLDGVQDCFDDIDEIQGISNRFRREEDLPKVNALWIIVRRQLLFSGRQTLISRIGEVFYTGFDEYSEILRHGIESMVLVLALESMGIAPCIENDEEVDAWLLELEASYLCAPLNSPAFESAFQEGKKCLCSIAVKESDANLLFFRIQPCQWNVFSLQRESVRSIWGSEATSQLFLGENESERFSVQRNERFLHNLIVQSCNIPIGYPAFVSPVLSSYDIPLNSSVF